MPDPTRRCAVVGLGVKAPGGCHIATFWHALLRAEGTAADIEELHRATEVGSATIGCRVTDDDSTDERYFRKPELRRIDNGARYGVAAAADAMESFTELVAPERRALVVGTGVGGLRTYKQQSDTFRETGVGRVSPFTVPMMMPNSMAGWLSLRHEIRGPAHTIATACASGASAIGEAARLVIDGRADLVLSGGAEAVMFTEAFMAFGRMEALAKPADHPIETASRPFDVHRNGFVMGEGAAMVALVPQWLAEREGLSVLAWVDGYGSTSDAHHMAAPLEDGSGAARCMELALADAGLEPGAITHINAHGTSTPRNDVAESRAITAVFGPESPPVTATKGVTGHLLGGSGAVEAVASILAAILGVVPPVANTTEVDAEVDVDVVVGEPRIVDRGPVLSNSFAFGGHNASLVLTPEAGAEVLAERWGVSPQG